MDRNPVLLYKTLIIGVILLFIGLAVTPGIIAISKTDYDFQNEKSSSLRIHIRHRPIIIIGNRGFNKLKGVTGGSGTEDDPYIISGWRFNSIFWNSITIINTDKHVIIRDNLFRKWGGLIGYALSTINAKNVTFSSNSIKGFGDAISINGGKKITIESNDVSVTGWGIRLDGANWTIIRGNKFTSCLQTMAIKGKNTFIEGNQLNKCSGGIDAYYGSNIYIRNNYFSAIDTTLDGYFYLILFHQWKGDAIVEDSSFYNCRFNSGIHFLNTNSLVIIRNNTLRDTDGYTIIGNGGLIENNTLNRCDFAIRVGNSIVQNNFVKSSFVAINVDEMCYVYNNTIEGNHVGINCPWQTKKIAIIANNFIENNDCGISCSENKIIQVNNNYISGNDEGFSYGGNKIINATMNWWGASNGPSGEGPGNGDTVSKNIDFEPWLNSTHPDAPMEPNIDGPKQGSTKTEYRFNISTIDPNNDGIYYFVNWGDGTATNLIGPFSSGREITLAHTWNKKDDYVIKVRAQDTHGHWSFWNLLEVKMKKGVNLK